MYRKKERILLVLRWMVSLGFLISTASSSQEGGPPTTCHQISQAIANVDLYKVSSITDSKGIARFHQIDIDRDGHSDDVSLFCPGSASLIPSDPCRLTIKRSTGKEISIEQPRLYLVNVASKVYAIATEFVEDKKKQSAYLLQSSQITLYCQNI